MNPFVYPLFYICTLDENQRQINVFIVTCLWCVVRKSKKNVSIFSFALALWSKIKHNFYEVQPLHFGRNSSENLYIPYSIFLCSSKARTALAETGFSHIFYFPICMRLNYSCYSTNSKINENWHGWGFLLLHTLDVTIHHIPTRVNQYPAILISRLVNNAYIQDFFL